MTLPVFVRGIAIEFDARELAWVNHVSGLPIPAFGVAALATVERAPAVH